jgi:hypothetical protein
MLRVLISPTQALQQERVLSNEDQKWKSKKEQKAKSCTPYARATSDRSNGNKFMKSCSNTGACGG